MTIQSDSSILVLRQGIEIKIVKFGIIGCGLMVREFASSSAICACSPRAACGDYTAVLDAGKHMLGEKPFGMDAKQNNVIMSETLKHPELFVRCSSEFPHYPAGRRFSI